MKSSLIKNLLFNVAAGLLAFAFLRYLPVSGSQLFCFGTVAGITLIALNDYRPRRQLSLKISGTKAIPQPVVRRRSAVQQNALVVA